MNFSALQKKVNEGIVIERGAPVSDSGLEARIALFREYTIHIEHKGFVFGFALFTEHRTNSLELFGRVTALREYSGNFYAPPKDLIGAEEAEALNEVRRRVDKWKSEDLEFASAFDDSFTLKNWYSE